MGSINSIFDTSDNFDDLIQQKLDQLDMWIKKPKTSPAAKKGNTADNGKKKGILKGQAPMEVDVIDAEGYELEKIAKKKIQRVAKKVTIGVEAPEYWKVTRASFDSSLRRNRSGTL